MPVRYEIRSAPDAEADYTPYGGVREFMLCRDPEVIIAGPAECLAETTILACAICGESHAIAEWAELQRSPVMNTVLGLRKAGVPFPKKRGALYRIIMDDGNEFIAAPGHILLTGNGHWRPVSYLRRFLSHFAERLPEYAACHPPSSWALDPESCLQGEHRLLDMSQCYLDRCGRDYRQDGVPLRHGAAAVLAFAQLSGGVPEHNRESSLGDDQASLGECNLLCLPYGHPSSGDCVAYPTVGSEGECPLPTEACGQNGDWYECAWLSLTGRCSALPALSPNPDSSLRRLAAFVSSWIDLLPAYYTGQQKQVKSVEYAGEGWYFDLTVPNAGHYLLNGLLHHNTGKSLGACWKFHLLALKYPGAQLAIIRKTRRSLVGSILQTWERQVLDGAPVTKYGSNNPQWYDYPNGSRVWVGGMDDPRKMLSTEFDAILVNQPEELSLPEWEVLTTRVTGRAGNMPYSFLCGDGNPGPPTHWIKSRARSATNPDGALTLIESTHRDNPTLYNPITGELTERGRRTMTTLDRLTGARKMRLRYGVWAQPEGAIYEIFDEERHKAVSFPIPMAWPRVVGIDPMGVYTGALWGAYDPIDRRLHIYREYLQPFGVTTPGHVSAILKLTGNETVFAWILGGPSERQAVVDWRGAGIPCIAPPNFGVWEGIDRVIQLLADGALVVHDCCVNLLSEIGSYRRKLSRGGEPTEIIENKSEYHGLDCLRYLVAWLTGSAETSEVVYRPTRIGSW